MCKKKKKLKGLNFCWISSMCDWACFQWLIMTSKSLESKEMTLDVLCSVFVLCSACLMFSLTKCSWAVEKICCQECSGKEYILSLECGYVNLEKIGSIVRFKLLLTLWYIFYSQLQVISHKDILTEEIKMRDSVGITRNGVTVLLSTVDIGAIIWVRRIHVKGVLIVYRKARMYRIAWVWSFELNPF